MTKLKATFLNADGAKLSIFAKNGKRGVNVAASLKTSGESAQTGCRSTWATEEEGAVAFNELKASAIANGWVATVKKDRSSFTEIPMANPKAAEPAAEPKKKSAKAA